MKKKILAGILSVLMSVTMYSPVIAEEMPEPTSGDPDITEIQETEKEDLAPGISEESAEPAVAEEAGETEDTEILPEEPEEEPVITEEPGETEPEIIGAEGTDDPEMLEGEANPEEPEETEEESAEEPEIILNADAFSEAYTVGALEVTVSYEAGTVPEGTEVVVGTGKPEAIEALKADRGDDIGYAAADISFVYEGEEIEPKDYSDNKVTVILTYKGEDVIDDAEFETLHIKETLDEEGNVVYGVETVDAAVVDETETVQVPYDYTWTETVTKYKDVDVYADVEVQVPYEEEVVVPVYETREITQERTTYVTRTRLVKKTKTVKVKVAVKWYDPSTWLGYKYVDQKYLAEEQYREPVTETVVIGTEQVQVGTETQRVTRYRTEVQNQYIRTDTVEDGTEEIVHTETRYNEETVVVGKTVTFETGEFSTFTMTWPGWNTTNRVTIHHGVMVNGSFTEFGTNGLPSSSNSVYPTSLNVNNYGTNSNNRFAYLIYDFPGYTYSATYYRTNTSSNPAQGGTSIKAVLRRDNFYGSGYWQYRENNSFNGIVANDSHIYVIYTPKTITQGASGSGSGGGQGQNAFTPDVGKDVTDQKADGTYDITLGFVGDKQPATYAKARVIVVFDRSGSMDDPVSSTESTIRLTAAKNAVNAMANKLLALEDSDGNKLVEMGLVSFGTNAQVETFGNNVQFTSTPSTFTNKVNGFTTSNLMGGTNWEKALDLANSMQAATDAKTYIVFISDGDPTFRLSRGNYLDYNTGTGSNFVYGIAEETRGDDDSYFYSDGVFGYGTNDRDTNNRCYDAAEIVAESIVEANKTLFVVGLSSDVERMSDLATEAGGTYYDGSNATTFADNMATIAGQIADEVGLTDVTITDGVTSMSQIGTESLIGTAGDFVYNKSYPLAQGASGYTYTIGQTTYNITQAQVDAGTDGTHKIFSRQVNGATVYYIEYPWSDIPEGAEADVNENNAVIWDTSAANSQLEHGVYYSVTFTVWPKQEAYDLIADLDNGIRKVTDSDLAAGTKAQLRVLVDGTTYEYDPASGTWTNGLTDAQLQAKIDAGDPVFSMKTNTGLSAEYKYGGVEQSHNYTNYTNGNMTLDDTAITVRKVWNNYLDAREAENVVLTITRNGANYTTIEMGEPVEVVQPGSGKHWEQTPEQELYISLGVLSVTGENITVRETGYDYTVTEPEEFSWRWDLHAEIYHPMVINGTTTVLSKVQDTTGLPATVTGLENNKTITVDGKTYYKFNNTLYVAKTGTNLLELEAVNDRRSDLIINKVVNETDAPADDFFPIQITVDDPNGAHPGDTGYGSYDTIWFYVSTAPNQQTAMITDGFDVEGATAETSGGAATGFYWFDNGGTATVYIKNGWYINVINLRRGATYSITEPAANMPDGYTFEAATFTYFNSSQEIPTSPTISGSSVDGIIDISNTDFKVTYDNKYEGVFYVYHSSDNTVERYPMAVDGVKVTSFDIFARTAANTLYGGYYSDYAGKSTGYDSAALTYTLDTTDNIYKSADGGTDKKAYTYQYISDSNRAAWASTNAYTTIGTAMVPEGGKTYFLKEVPTAYNLPYTHYTYNKSDKVIRNMWYISSTDDLNYGDAGFFVETYDANGKKTATVVSTLKITNTTGGATVTLSPKSVFGNKGGTGKGVQAGYLTYWNASSLIAANTTSVFTPFWLTMDGIYVCNKTKATRTIAFNTGKVGTGGMAITDADTADGNLFPVLTGTGE